MRNNKEVQNFDIVIIQTVVGNGLLFEFERGVIEDDSSVVFVSAEVMLVLVDIINFKFEIYTCVHIVQMLF